MVRDVTENLPPDSPSDVVGILEDFDALKSSQPSLPGPQCGVTAALDTIVAASPELAVPLRERVASSAYPALGVAEILSKRSGQRVSAYTVRRHRKRGTSSGCRCTR